MDFNFTSEQRALAESVARFTARDYGFETRSRLVGTGDGWSEANWSTFADLGWLGAGLAEDAGGYGGGPVENMIIMEGFGRALVIDPFLPVAIQALQTLAALASSATREALITAILAGEPFPVVAHGELAARGDSALVETRIEGGRICGRKSMVLGAAFANRLIVSANGLGGIGLYLVDSSAPGIVTRRYRLLDNQHVMDVTFERVEVLETLAEPGLGLAAVENGIDHAMIGICAEAVGAMDAAIQITKDYISTRRQFGTTLNSFQALQHRMADMLVEMELSRSILYQGIASLGLEQARRSRALSAMKAIVSSAAMFVGRNAVQLHGGIGITEECSIGHYYRRLYVIASQYGDESLHLRKMAASPQPFWEELSIDPT